MNFEQIQEELIIWQQHNFPGRDTWMPLMGLGEELGELADAINEEEAEDAIGDCCIYLADFCNGMGLSLTHILTLDTEKVGLNLITAQIIYGKMCHSFLKLKQRIRMHEGHQQQLVIEIKKLLAFLDNYCHGTLEVISWETWLKVRQRDWQKDNNKAHEKVQ